VLQVATCHTTGTPGPRMSSASAVLKAIGSLRCRRVAAPDASGMDPSYIPCFLLLALWVTVSHCIPRCHKATNHGHLLRVKSQLLDVNVPSNSGWHIFGPLLLLQCTTGTSHNRSPILISRLPTVLWQEVRALEVWKLGWSKQKSWEINRQHVVL